MNIDWHTNSLSGRGKLTFQRVIHIFFVEFLIISFHTYIHCLQKVICNERQSLKIRLFINIQGYTANSERTIGTHLEYFD